MEVLVLIPARGGSKGLPGKNIKPLEGTPLIAHSINHAKGSKYVTRIIVSTDDQEIANVAKQYGAEIPFMRPQELATDTAIAVDTYIYTLNKLKHDEAYEPDILIILQPTSPLRASEDIDNAIEIYKEKQADSVIGVVEYEHPLARAKKILEDGRMLPYLESEGQRLQNRQQMKKAFSPNGAVYVLNPKLVKETKTYYTSNTFPYIMSREKAVDIDTIDDFNLAIYYLKKRK